MAESWVVQMAELSAGQRAAKTVAMMVASMVATMVV
jgi:hypothetical protein